ncbi:SurA N-terminal domain-containing protein [Halomonas denitrificans]|nr:SurA N-terminal domain-containing protein [Halomonas denitrificans]
MLQAIRDRVTGVVAFIILGLLAVPFLFFGVDSYIRDVPQDTIAEVGDQTISITEFQTEFARYRQQLRAQQGENYNDLEVNRPERRREFLEQMIDQRLLSGYAQEQGLAISPAALLEVIRGVPAFQINGQFDPQIYRQRLQATGRTVQQFERELTRDLLLQEVPAAVSSSAFVTEDAIDDWLRVQQQERDVALVAIDSAPYRDPEAVTDEAIGDYYEANTDRFMRPEQITVEYVELDTAEQVADVEIDEETLRDRYEAVKARFITPEERNASHILITAGEERTADEAEALAESLRERIDNGEAFGELAAEFSDDPVSAEDGGDLGWLEPGIIDPAFDDALFALDIGEISAPVESDFGWHIIRLDDIREPRGQSFEEARAEVLEEVRAERAEELYFELSERLVDLVYADPTGLAAISEDLGLELQTAGPYSRFSAEGVLADPAVLEAAFSDLVLVDRQASEPIEVGENRAIVLRVTDYQPEQPRPLEAVENEIRDQLAREAAQERAREYGESLIARVRAGQTLSEVAEAESLEVDERSVTRRDFDLGGAVLEGVFRMAEPAEGETRYELVDRGQGWTVVALRGVTPGDPAEADEAQRNGARQQLQFAAVGREVQGLLAWLRANTEINVADERLE